MELTTGILIDFSKQSTKCYYKY